MWAGISVREKKYSSAVMITPQNYNCAAHSIFRLFVGEVWISLRDECMIILFFVPGGRRALITSYWRVILY